MSLDWLAIETKWQRKWNEERIFETDPKSDCKKLFLTVAYPYPNSPQHVGHGRTFTLTDVYARFKRMQGYNVLFPMAFHYTGTPVLAIAKRISSGDKELLSDFTDIFKVPQEVLKSFVEPVKIADYFRNEIKQSMKEIGYSIDWRREFTTIDPAYKRFIEWQFRKLMSKGLITRGSHPVGWCQSCGNPMGQHDTKGDVEPDLGDLTLIKFIFGEAFLPAGTLRPETIFGVTNIWVRPDIEYVKAEVDGEIWIVSEECVNKLVLLGHKTSHLTKIKGKDLIGKRVINPISEKEIPILPASFVDPNNATGVVMSVPAHAPYDHVALENLKKTDLKLLDLDLESELVNKIVPISIISLKNHSDYPAVDVVSRLNVGDQNDEKLEKATKEVYSNELRNGVMNENTGECEGFSVAEARERVKEELIQNRKADTMYELLNRPVYCRCGSEVVVKIFKDQWFIDYGNLDWKKLAHQCLDTMRIYPEELRVEFINVINWLREKACARKQGLGTNLPWDKQWIIESLSDSVIYMSYYTIVKTLKENNIRAEKLGDDVFDYVFLGESDPSSIGHKTGIKPSVLREMRNQFCYFYPLDNRGSGRDLVPNHLTYFIFNHVAIFPQELWPKQIVVNGSVLMEGKKMSKSFGNIIPLRTALRKYGADPFRVTILATSELLQDADFSSVLAKSVRERLERFYSFSLELIETQNNGNEGLLSTIDFWLLSRIHQRVKMVTEAMENMRFREAVHNALYMFDQDFQWYIRRSESNRWNKTQTGILRRAMEIRTLLLAPFAPHLCEEIWELFGKRSLISVSKWPIYAEDKIDLKVIEREELIKTLRDDVSSIIRATKITPNRIFFYTAPHWKWQAYLKSLELFLQGKDRVGDLIKDLLLSPDFKKIPREISAFAKKMAVDLVKMTEASIRHRLKIGPLDEKELLSDAKSFYEKEFNTEIIIHAMDDPNLPDPKGRAKYSEPYRPAIYIE